MSNQIAAWVDGKLTPVGKLEAHERGLKHPAVSVFLMAGDKTLIQQRAAGKYHTPNLWANTVCTHPLIGETPIDCAHRRLNDELGITGTTLTHCQTVEYRADVGNDLIEHEVVDIFIGQTRLDVPYTLNPDEVQSIRWLTLADLQSDIAQTPNIFTPWLQIYMSKHLDEISQALKTLPNPTRY